MITLAQDYSLAAPYFDSRADYSEAALKECLRRLGLQGRDAVADVGAGTGKLSAMLGRFGLHVQAVEPCAAMRTYGADKTCGMAIEWHEGRAESLPLQDQSAAAVFFGSCWHELDQRRALEEARRVGRGICSICNVLDTSDPLQRELMAAAQTEWPDFAAPTVPSDLPGVERIEEEFLQIFDRESFLNMWRSCPSAEGDQLIFRLSEVLDDLEEIEVPYTTVAWIARFS